MTNPYIGEIRLFGGNFAPAGWAICNGQTLPISQNDTLFNLIGTTYGGDGLSTFNLPDLQSRVPIHQGNLGGTFVLGEMGGVETVTLTTNQLPAHTHTLLGTAQAATTPSPAGNLLAASGSGDLYIADTPTVSLNAASVGSAGGSQPHDNLMPFVCLNYIISLYGVFPSQT